MSMEHIVKAYDDELDRLNQNILNMGGMAERQLADAIQAMVKRDAELAEAVIAGDRRIDAIEHDVENQAIRLLALRQPMAGDLRNIVAALKISSEIERIGDYAKNIAKRVGAVSQGPQSPSVKGIERMARLAQGLIKDVLDAYGGRDPDKAIAARRRDEEVDGMYTSLFRELLTYMMEDARNITPCTHLLFVARNLERIGDHATNIAEIVYFWVRGGRLADERPKGDETSFTVVGAPDATEGEP
jgi:phosphate transport system protein